MNGNIEDKSDYVAVKQDDVEVEAQPISLSGLAYDSKIFKIWKKFGKKIQLSL